ncbi:hypothetical protein BMS3Abin16_00866 [archaeon BMS3Abin16]|nr:hypothetical protein BMS3Abin16_00866 [archaeon BMS3Abin16]GBE56283.1 hypothetical protein BMS3Bbin16_00483 [archaeon BMS3Bbin16]
MRDGKPKEKYQTPKIQSKEVNIGTYGTYGDDDGGCHNPLHGHGGKGGPW